MTTNNREHPRPAQPEPAAAPPRKRRWAPMELKYVAQVSDIAMPGILKGGTIAETGGTFKVRGQFG